MDNVEATMQHGFTHKPKHEPKVSTEFPKKAGNQSKETSDSPGQDLNDRVENLEALTAVLIKNCLNMDKEKTNKARKIYTSQMINHCDSHNAIVTDETYLGEAVGLVGHLNLTVSGHFDSKY